MSNPPRSPRRNTQQRDRDRELLARIGAPCHICGKPIDYTLPYRYPDGTVNPASFVADHVHAYARGGADRIENKRPAHARCNSAKGDRPHAAILRTSGVLG